MNKFKTLSQSELKNTNGGSILIPVPVIWSKKIAEWLIKTLK